MRSASGHRLPECRSAPDRPARRWFGCWQPGLTEKPPPGRAVFSLQERLSPEPRRLPYAGQSRQAVASSRVWVARVQEELARGGHVFSASAWNGRQLRRADLSPAAGKAEPFCCHASCAPHRSHHIAPPYIVSLSIAPRRTAPQRGEGMQVCLGLLLSHPLAWRISCLLQQHA